MSKGDISEAQESPERQFIKTPEKKINTYDDLGTSDNSGKIETYNDLRRSGNEKSINTYDDLRAPNDGAEKTNTTKVSDSPEHQMPEMVEQRRIDQAAEGIRGQEWMKPEKWKTLSNDEKRIALDHSGKELGKAYDSPEPPLSTKKMGNPNLQGVEGDGFSYHPESPDADEHGIVGSDYGIKMNEDAVTQRNEKLFGDDPKAALETYSHEFRHSYHNEQAQRYEKDFKVDDPTKAKEWSENLKDYKQPPDTKLAGTDPERYFKEYDAYRNQPVERDARDFADKLTSKTYTKEEEKAGAA